MFELPIQVFLILSQLIISLILQVVGQNYYHVKPSTSDINENLLSEQCRTDYGLTEVSIKEALPLAAVIHR